VSIALVLLFHAIQCLQPNWSSTVLSLFNVGLLGVRVFFVISGFLITQLLIAEQSRTGTIGLAHFYFRRTMRIFPPFYAYLAVVLILRAVGAMDTPASAVAHAATYTTNYVPSSWIVGHSWSLSVEEQFYLVWPAIMNALGPRRWLWGVALMLVVSPAMRLWYPSPTSSARLDLVADSLAAGCLLAGVRGRLLASAMISRWMRSSWVFVAAAAGIFGIELAIPHPSVAPPWLVKLALISIQNVLVAVVIHWSILNHTGRVGRVLNWSPVAFVGMISYSLYIWQQPFFNPDVTSPLTTFPLNLAAAFACALLSYYLVEQPSLRLRRHMDGWFRVPNVLVPPARGFPAAP